MGKKIPARFRYAPDVLATKDGSTFAFFIRQSDSIPEVLIQRIASMRNPKKKLNFFVVFSKEPRKQSVKLLNLYGMGIKIVRNGKMKNAQRKVFEVKKKIISKEQKRERAKKMPLTEIFVSSHQEIEERNKSEDITEELYACWKFPFKAIFVEKDTRYSINQTDECIEDNLKNSELFLGILADEYRPVVDKKEIRRAFQLFDLHQIMIFVKANRNCKKNWSALIKWIKDKETVKYVEYNDLTDFEIKLKRWLMERAQEIHNRLEIPFMSMRGEH